MQDDLKITISGQALDLFPGTKLRWVENSPLFDYDYLLGDYSYKIELPATGNNNSIFMRASRQSFSYLQPAEPDESECHTP